MKYSEAYKGLNKQADLKDLLKNVKQKISDLRKPSETPTTGQKTLPVSTAEYFWPGVGALAGGGAGWLLAGLIHKRPTWWKRLIYALAGAGAGGAGTLMALHNIKNEQGQTLAQAYREQQAHPERAEIAAAEREKRRREAELERKRQEKYEDLTESLKPGMVNSTLAVAGGGAGFIKGRKEDAKRRVELNRAMEQKVLQAQRELQQVFKKKNGSFTLNDLIQEAKLPTPTGANAKLFMEHATWDPNANAGKGSWTIHAPEQMGQTSRLYKGIYTPVGALAGYALPTALEYGGRRVGRWIGDQITNI